MLVFDWHLPIDVAEFIRDTDSKRTAMSQISKGARRSGRAPNVIRHRGAVSSWFELCVDRTMMRACSMHVRCESER